MPEAAPGNIATGSVVLIVAPESGERERLVTDLVTLGYLPLLHIDGLPSSESTPAIALVLTNDVRGHAAACSEELRRTEGLRSVPLMWLLDESELVHLAGQEHLLDEFITVPYPVAELGVRLALLRQRRSGDEDDVVSRGPLVLNPLSYQVSLEGRPLDLTFMEYELLKLLMGYPGRVYTREEILSLVWGYDYFGGMRTVDVHVRRVRAKLGQDHAWLIETVRGVGYRLAQVRA